MSDITLEIANYSAITIRLEPTTVSGRSIAGQPALHLPFKIQLLPVQGQKTELQYTLIRLAGKVQNQALNEFASFDIGPTALSSHPSPNYFRHQEAAVLMDRHRVRAFEDARGDGDAHLQFALSCLIWFPGNQSFDAKTSTSYLDLQIPKSHWIDKVLSAWNLHKVKLVQVEFPSNTAGQNFRAAYTRVEEAERDFANGQYKQVLTDLRIGMEELAKHSGFPAAGQDFFEFFFSSCHQDKKEKARDALTGLYRFLHLGPHAQTTQGAPASPPVITREDARFALLMAYTIFEYITPR